jgi:tetratricopeptide (TPR) repeat protein
MLAEIGLGPKPPRGIVPLLLAAALLAALVWSRPAAAEAAPETDTKELLREGFAALKKNDLETARTAFTSAWNKRQHFAVAFSLAEVEMRLGRYVEAAQHWQYVLANIPDDLADKREQAAQQLDECRNHVGVFTVHVSADGASVHVDGVHVGDSPLTGELYVQPGDHEIYAEKSGRRSPVRLFRISAGSNLSFELRVPPTALQLPASRQTAQSSLASGTDHVAQPSPATSIRTPVLIAGLVATAGAAAVGTVFVLKSNGASDDARDALNQAVAQSDPSRDPSTVCGGPNRAPACDTAFKSIDDKDRFRDLAVGSFIASGVFAAGTAAAYWLWPQQSPAKGVAVLPAPTILRGGGGLAFAGSF